MTAIATLKIWRGAARDAGHFESHEVPFEEGQSVLDGLRWLRIKRIRRWRCATPASMPMPARNA